MSDSDHTCPENSRPIPNLPGYRICDGGTIWSRLKCGRGSGKGYTDWHIVKSRKSGTSGHMLVDLTCNGKRSTFCVHRLVLEAFVGPCPPGLECCHGDGNPANNFVSNLRWDTRKNNHADKKKHGTDLTGERHPGAKLRATDIPEIFSLATEGKTLAQIAIAYGIGPKNVHSILTRKTWSHIPISEEMLVRPKDMQRGKGRPSAKLKVADIPEIFRLHRAGIAQQRIAEIFGISASTVSLILLRRTWCHVPIPSEETNPCTP